MHRNSLENWIARKTLTTEKKNKCGEKIQFKSIQFHFRVLISLGLSVTDELFCYLHNRTTRECNDQSEYWRCTFIQFNLHFMQFDIQQQRGGGKKPNTTKIKSRIKMMDKVAIRRGG